MYAVIRNGGKQYKVEPGDLLKLEKLDAAIGDKIVLDEVLLIQMDERMVVGNPLVQDAQVLGEVEAQGRGKKIIVYKQKRRKGYSKKQGHRQEFTGIRIKEILQGASEKQL